MTGRAILVSLILVLAIAAMTARADDRVPGRYVPAEVQDTSGGLPTDSNAPVPIELAVELLEIQGDWKIYAISGGAALLGALIGAGISWLIAWRQRKHDDQMFGKKITHEGYAAARSVALAFESLVDCAAAAAAASEIDKYAKLNVRPVSPQFDNLERLVAIRDHDLDTAIGKIAGVRYALAEVVQARGIDLQVTLNRAAFAYEKGWVSRPKPELEALAQGLLDLSNNCGKAGGALIEFYDKRKIRKILTDDGGSPQGSATAAE